MIGLQGLLLGRPTKQSEPLLIRFCFVDLRTLVYRPSLIGLGLLYYFDYRTFIKNYGQTRQVVGVWLSTQLNCRLLYTSYCSNLIVGYYIPVNVAELLM